MSYFLFPEGPRLPSLAALITHCQRGGVSEHAGLTKTFLAPDGSRSAAVGGRFGSGRFSHVRLKTPIPSPPPRRN